MNRTLLLILATLPGAWAQSHYLVENFSAALPSNTQITTEINFKDPKIGLASTFIRYQINPQTRTAILPLGNERRLANDSGTLKLWIKGDQSGNELELLFRRSKPETGPDGQMRFTGQSDFALPRIKLDFEGWKEVSWNLPEPPTGTVGWWQELRVIAPKDGTHLTGSIEVDDLRHYPLHKSPNALSTLGLIGRSIREFGTPMELFLDVRNFTAKPVKLQANFRVTDRNDDTVVEREFHFEGEANQTKEFRLDLAPENLAAFLPPFKISGDVISADLPELSTRLDTLLVQGNSRYLVDDFSNVTGRWFTAGTPSSPRSNARSWLVWTHGEAQRATPLLQTSARISRVPNEAVKDKPPGRYAMRVDYSGDAVIYNGRQRYLPGNAYRAGFWVRGDGSNSKLYASFLDFTRGADFWEGGWKRTTEGERLLATLNFTDWRYVEVELPGRGRGSNTPNGSTLEIDFPLELTALRVESATPETKGTVWIGPIEIYTQQALSGSLSVQLGYDQPENRWESTAAAHVNVQNASLAGPRKLTANWTLLDRTAQPILNGQHTLDLAAGAAGSFAIDLAKSASEIAKRPAPYTLQVNAYDSADASVTTTSELVLTHPDSQALVADFETDRGYLGLKGRDITNAPPIGQTSTRTSTEQAHSGQRSLAIDWNKEALRQRFVSVDPPLPGVPVELSVWVYGDGSGVWFYPLIGDRRGINHGLPNGQWNFFLPRTEGEWANAVRVDWQGWRELTFRLPPPAPNWNQSSPSLGFVPNYPLGVHLAVDSTSATAPSGRLFVDDLRVKTHLLPEDRVELILNRSGEANVVSPGAPLTATVTNHDLATKRSFRLQGGLFDWRGHRVAGTDQNMELAPGERRIIELAKTFPPGFYEWKATLHEPSVDGKPGTLLADIQEDLLAADPSPLLGPDWVGLLDDEWKLRRPIGERFSSVDEDWDWVEPHPGNLQVDTIRNRARRVSEAGGEPYLLLGYSAYWASGVGFDQMKAGAYVRIPRDVGNAVNTFMIPQRVEDWSDYVSEVMRKAEGDVSGWLIWDGPDSNGPMRFPPDQITPFLQTANEWRKVYSPDKPLLLGGMGRETAIPYLQELAKTGGLDSLTGINVRLDVGRLSPEDAGILGYSRELNHALNPQGTKRTLLFTDLDWAVENTDSGLNAFDQAAYLARSALLLHGTGIRSALALRNADDVRLGLGLAYRRELFIPPMKEKPRAYQFKPAYWAMARVREWLQSPTAPGSGEIADVIPGRTRSLVQKNSAGNTQVIVWRNDNPGFLSFANAGLQVKAAEDLFGSPVPDHNGEYAIGKVPCRFTLSGTATPTALARMQVRDGAKANWPQRTLAMLPPGSGGTDAVLAGRTATGEVLEWTGKTFRSGESERFTVSVPAGSSLVLRKQFLLDESGQEAEVFVNGKSAGRWDLQRKEKELSSGLRDAIFFVEASLLNGRTDAEIEMRYRTNANTAAWRVMEWQEGSFPISATGLLHADQNAGPPRFARNMIGGPLRIGESSFTNGIGAFARSLLEIPLNGQFKSFTTKVGVDAITEGRGSVVFEIYGDGKKLWASPMMSGLDAPKEATVDITGVNRLRLVVNDGGDGNKFDVANWLEPVLKR